MKMILNNNTKFYQWMGIKDKFQWDFKATKSVPIIQKVTANQIWEVAQLMMKLKITWLVQLINNQ